MYIFVPLFFVYSLCTISLQAFNLFVLKYLSFDFWHTLHMFVQTVKHCLLFFFLFITIWPINGMMVVLVPFIRF